jgi:hypothetical protein
VFAGFGVYGGDAAPVKDRPILFSAPMVRAILAGKKTQTRRVIKPQPPAGVEYAVRVCPYGKTGDRLWVRETWARDDEDGQILYRADDSAEVKNWDQQRYESGLAKYNWRPSIFMRREYSRITLVIDSIRTQLLLDIADSDCVAEGCEGGPGSIPGTEYHLSPLEHFRYVWNSINPPYSDASWASNPWVWVVDFSKVNE